MRIIILFEPSGVFPRNFIQNFWKMDQDLGWTLQKSVSKKLWIGDTFMTQRRYLKVFLSSEDEKDGFDS